MKKLIFTFFALCATLSLCLFFVGCSSEAECPHDYTEWTDTINHCKMHKQISTCNICRRTRTRFVSLKDDAPHDYGGDNICDQCSFFTGVNFVLNGTKTGYIAQKAPNTAEFTKIIIPETHDGLPVTEISSKAFEGCTQLAEIIMPDTITSTQISFKDCTSLKRIEIPASVTSLSQKDFQNCYSLEEITVASGNKKYHSEGNCVIDTKDNALIVGCKTSVIPDDGSVTHIGTYAFSGQTELKQITLPEAITSIAMGAFENTGLTQISIPSAVTELSLRAFSGCTELISVTLPASVTLIAHGSFEGCQNLQSITVDKDNPKYYVEGNCIIEKDTLTLVRAFNSSTIPSCVTVLGASSFSDCDGLTEITVPKKVTSIYANAFSGCDNLSKVTFEEGCTVSSIRENAFSSCHKLAEFTLPNTVEYLNPKAFTLCSGLTELKVEEDNPVYHSQNNCIINTESKTLVLGCQASVIPTDGSVTSIGENAFIYCTALKEIAIPATVTSIGKTAFYNCTGLTEVVIPESVEDIAYNAFSYCNDLTVYTPLASEPQGWDADWIGACPIVFNYAGLTFGENGLKFALMSTDEVAVIGYTGTQTKISIPAQANGYTVTRVVSYAFSNRKELTEIALPDTITRIDKYAFNGCESLTALSIPGSTAYIGDYAFCNCNSLTHINVPKSVSFLGMGAFEDCYKIKTVTFEEGSELTEISASAFNSCSRLSSISIPEGVTAIKPSAFETCSNLTEITLPTSLKTIEASAFNSCYKLTNIDLPDGVKLFGDAIFYKCRSLTYIVIPEGTTVISSLAFQDCTALTGVELPSSVIDIGYNAFKGCTSLADVKLSEGLNTVGENAFYGCTALTSIELPSSVTKISRGAFYRCTALKSITIPEGLGSIGWEAFDDSGLESINYLGTIYKWNNIFLNRPCIPEYCLIICKDGTLDSTGRPVTQA